ncbi:MAG: TetR family transcriptional regulator [Acidimicrobiaceae bacterium]|nr:TetR family transcriptional regulator [Acidimicrobiaceae bacterium]
MDGEERWEEILTAAGEIFEQKGYEAASLQDIASAVGILKGSMYYYIKTKEDLLYELVRRAQAARLHTMDESDELRASFAPDRLAGFIGRWMAETEKQRVWNRVAEQDFRRLRGRRLRAVIERRDKFSAFVKSIIVQGIEEGNFDPTVDPSVATNTIFELMNTSRMWYQPTGRLSLTEIGDWYATFVVRGLGGPDWSSHGAGVVVPRIQHRLRAAEARPTS